MAREYTKIIEVSHGVMNRFEDGIEVNKHLHKYPKLYLPIMKHELQHSNKTFSLYDLKHDLNSINKVDQIQLLKFMFKHPKSFTQILPFYYTPRRKFVFDLNLCIIYSVLILIGWGIYSWLY